MTAVDHLHAAVRAAGIGLWDWSLSHARLTLALGCAEVLGVTGDAIASGDPRDWARWVHPDDRARLGREGAAYVARGEGAFQAIVRVGAPDASERWVELRGQLVAEADGPHLIGSVIDVTGRERTRRELARHARALRMLTDANQALMRSGDDATLAAEVCRIAVEDGGYRLAWIGLVAPGPPVTVTPIAQAGCDEGYLVASEAAWKAGRGPAAIAATEARACVVRDILDAPAFGDRVAAAAACGYRSAAALPARVGSEVVAVLKVYAGDRDAFDDAEVAILQELADDIGFGLTAVRTSRQRDEAVRELQTLIGSMPDMIARFDATGRFTYVNDAARRATGVVPAALAGRTAGEVGLCATADEDRATMESVARVLATGVTEQLEVHFKALTGSQPFEVRHVPVCDGHGQVTGVVGIARDLTERRAAERQLYLLNYAIDAIGDGIFLLEGDTPRIAYVNQAAADSLGYTRAELTGGMTLFDIDPRMTPEAWTQLVAVMRERRRMTIESEHRTRDGRRIPVEITGNYFAFGGAMHNLAVVRDVSARKAAEAAQRATERQLATVTTAINDVFWLADARRTTFSFVGAAYARVFGEPPPSGADAVASWDRHIDAADRARVRAAVAALPDSPYDLEYRIRRSDGQMRWIHDRAVPVRDADGRVEQLAGVAADVTRRRTLEEELSQAQKMEAVGQLAGGIAHDFNNMLAIVSMQAALLRDVDREPEQLRAGLDEIVAATDRAANLTRQLLMFSRRQVAQPVDLDLAETLGAMLKLLRRVLGEHIALETRFASELPGVHADRGMMEQLLTNLAINARDAMPDGGQLVVALDTVEVDADRAARAIGAHPGRHVALTVSDTGAGIAAEHLPRIFEPFFTTKPVGKGTGLGLATVFGIVTLHHGIIEVASAPGAGTSFTVLLPAIAARTLPSTIIGAPRAVSGGTETVLLVEDDTALRRTTAAALAGAGYQVLEAASASAALAIWASVGPSIALVMTDLIMPGPISGRQLADILGTDRPTLPILYTTGYSLDAVEQPLPLGPTRRFLPKPYSADALIAGVRASLDAAAAAGR
jgi:PAS domain S-box-containing protein